MCELSPVSFHGDTIFCVEFNGQPYAPMRSIVENLGLDWSAQYRKVYENKERWGVAIIAIPSEGGRQETSCIPVRKLPAWLASINPKKVKPELRAKIELYQNECDDALWNYWMKGVAERQKALEPKTISPAEQAALKLIVDEKLTLCPKGLQGKARAEVWARFNRHFKIAKYSQLPAEKMSEARNYLISMEVETLNEVSLDNIPINDILTGNETNDQLTHLVAHLIGRVEAYWWIVKTVMTKG